MNAWYNAGGRQAFKHTSRAGVVHSTTTDPACRRPLSTPPFAGGYPRKRPREYRRVHPTTFAETLTMDLKRRREMRRTWAVLVQRVQAGDRDAIEDLYHAIIPGMRMMLALRVSRCYVDDYAHDSFLNLVRYIQSGAIENPDCLPGVARTIVLRVCYEHIAKRATFCQQPVTMAAMVQDREPTPERRMIAEEKIEIAKRALECLQPREREILRRFYLENQSREQICAEMGLTETQFRVIKSRAKARFGEIGQRLLRRPLRSVA